MLHIPDAEYVYLVKNLRCIFSPGGSPERNAELAVWLGRKFRYRTVGIPVRALDKLPDEPLKKKLSKKPFHPLSLPDALAPEIQKLPAEESPQPEAVALSLLYCAPVVTDKDSLMRLAGSSSCVWRKESAGTVEDRDIRFNIRLSDYAMTDFLARLTQSPEEGPPPAEELPYWLERRRQMAIGDGSKRYWRLDEQKNGNPGPHLMIAYFDLWQILAEQRGRAATFLSLLKEHPLLTNFSIWIGLSLEELFQQTTGNRP